MEEKEKFESCAPLPLFPHGETYCSSLYGTSSMELLKKPPPTPRTIDLRYGTTASPPYSNSSNFKSRSFCNRFAPSGLTCSTHMNSMCTCQAKRIDKSLAGLAQIPQKVRGLSIFPFSLLCADGRPIESFHLWPCCAQPDQANHKIQRKIPRLQQLA